MAGKLLGPPGFDFSQVNALKFAEIWNHFDKDSKSLVCVYTVHCFLISCLCSR